MGPPFIPTGGVVLTTALGPPLGEAGGKIVPRLLDVKSTPGSPSVCRTFRARGPGPGGDETHRSRDGGTPRPRQLWGLSPTACPSLWRNSPAQQQCRYLGRGDRTGPLPENDTSPIEPAPFWDRVRGVSVCELVCLVKRAFRWHKAVRDLFGCL